MTRMVNEVSVAENSHFIEPKICYCYRGCSSNASVELETIKLHMTIFVTNVRFLEKVKSEISLLKAKQNDMEGVLGHQDKLIGRINKKNTFLKSKLYFFEHLMLLITLAVNSKIKR